MRGDDNRKGADKSSSGALFPSPREDGTQSAPQRGMRTIRRLTQLLLTLIGTAIVLYAVLRVESTYNRVLVVALGLLFVEAGIWELTRSLFPNEREFKPLRKETDYFLTIVRRLNRASIRARAGAIGSDEEVNRLHMELHHSVDRMRRLAGLSEEELGFRHQAGGAVPESLDPLGALAPAASAPASSPPPTSPSPTSLRH
jgi:hypothetical protein